MPFSITVPGKVKLRFLSDEKLPIEQFKDFLSSALTRLGISIVETENTKIKFKVPFIIYWKWGTSILFLISSGEIELIQEGYEVNVNYRLNLTRLFLYVLVPFIIVMILEFSFEGSYSILYL